MRTTEATRGTREARVALTPVFGIARRLGSPLARLTKRCGSILFEARAALEVRARRVVGRIDAFGAIRVHYHWVVAALYKNEANEGFRELQLPYTPKALGIRAHRGKSESSIFLTHSIYPRHNRSTVYTP